MTTIQRRRKHSALSTGSVASSITTAAGTAGMGHSFSLEHGSDAGSSGGSSSIAADSMRPVAPPARKRRRTMIDAFSSINLNNQNRQLSSNAANNHMSDGNNYNNTISNSNSNNEGDDTEDCGDADSSQAVADYVEENEEITTSSIEDDDNDDPDDDDGGNFLLSDKEEAERKVMFEVVLGPMGSSSIKDEHGPLSSRDDEEIHPPYARPMSMSNATATTSSTSTSLTRSNSLPDMLLSSLKKPGHGSEGDDTMLDDSGGEDDVMFPPAPVPTRIITSPSSMMEPPGSISVYDAEMPE